MQNTWDRYHSICSAIKCPLEITADNYFVTSNGAFYGAIQAAYIVLRIMGYLRVSCIPSTIILSASVCLPIRMFVHASVCASLQLEIHSPEKRIRSQIYGYLHKLHSILYLTFTASLFDGKLCLFSNGSGEINKQPHSWNI